MKRPPVEHIVDGLADLGLGQRFGPALVRYSELLTEVAIPSGFLGPREADRLVERHILDSAFLQQLLPEGSLIDVGSGAGLPGVVLAVLRENVTVLLEAEGRRAVFLARVLASLELESRARVIRARAEDAGRSPELREAFDIAVARALAPPPVALEYCLPFVRSGGVCVLQVGSTDIEASRRAAKQLSGSEPRLIEKQVPGAPVWRRAMIVRKVGVIGDRYPRRAGVPAKRPLG